MSKMAHLTSAPPSAALAARLKSDFTLLEAHERLVQLRHAVIGRVLFTTSFGLEDQVLTHLIASERLEVEIVTLDTGRLFPQTYELWQETEEHFGCRIRALHPERDLLEAFVSDVGVNGFYSSLEARKACCDIRKVRPLARALAGASAWITGLRSEQSPERNRSSLAEFDAERELIKVNPLLDWTREETLSFARQRGVPTNPLHASGYLSIGCAPCTRAVRPGEDERSGRWWWESEEKKECGLHVDANGRLTRATGAPQS